MATLCAHGYGQQASYQCAVTRNSYVVAVQGCAIYAIGTAEAVCMLEAIFCHLVGPTVTCSHGCVLMAATR